MKKIEMVITKHCTTTFNTFVLPMDYGIVFNIAWLLVEANDTSWD